MGILGILGILRVVGASLNSRRGVPDRSGKGAQSTPTGAGNTFFKPLFLLNFKQPKKIRIFFALI
jgi:hypothetical protein